jgi:CheY-like chemotaxis protein
VNPTGLVAEVPSRILIIEDNPVDARIIRYALQSETGWHIETIVMADGEEAIDYLVKEVACGNVSRPDLVILDVTLPKRDGIEVLQAIQSNESLTDLVVVMLTSYPEDVIREKAARANVAVKHYLSKPSEVGQFAELGRKLRDFCAPDQIP